MSGTLVDVAESVPLQLDWEDIRSLDIVRSGRGELDTAEVHAGIVRIPINMATDYGLSFQHSGEFGDVFPYQPWAASDYDGNGVLDPTADFAAFLIGHGNQDFLADTNADGIWDFDDVLLWQDHFNEDYNQ